MIGIGTIVNVIAVFAGTTVGMFLKEGLPDRFQKIITSAIGLSTMFIGIAGVLAGLLYIENGRLSSQNSMLLIFSLILGGIVGEVIDIERRLETLGESAKRLLEKKDTEDTSFVDGFVTASLVFCVGAMSIVGSFNDGMLGDPTTLYAKSILDGTISIVFATTFGVGVYLSAISVAIYQGILTILAQFISPLLSETMIANMSCVGSVLIFCIGLNFIFGKKIKTGNLLPAMFMPIILGFVL